MLLSIIVPVYNEKNEIIKTIYEINKYFNQKKYIFEIIIVDDGSKEDISKYIQRIEIKNVVTIRNNKNLGKGNSIKKGILQSKGKVILVTDADLSTPIKEFDNLYRELLTGKDIVIGSRNIAGANIIIKQNYIRISIGKFFNILVRYFTKLNFKDTQCGFKLFDANKLKQIALLCFVDRFCIDVEILFIATKLGYNISEIGIEWKNDTKSSVNLIRDSYNMFQDLLKIKKIHNLITNEKNND